MKIRGTNKQYKWLTRRHIDWLIDFLFINSKTIVKAYNTIKKNGSRQSMYKDTWFYVKQWNKKHVSVQDFLRAKLDGNDTVWQSF